MPYFAKFADSDSFQLSIKTVGGQPMILVATKTSRRRGLKKGKTQYIYLLEGTKGVYWNEKKSGNMFVPMARQEINMRKHYDLYCVSPLTPAEVTYLTLHPHIKILK